MDYRKILPIVFVLILFGALFFRKAPEGSLKEGRYLLGTICEIELVGHEPKERKKILNDAFSIIEKYDALLSNYKPSSDISKLNRSTSGEWVSVSSETSELLQKSVYYSDISDGLFDITVFPLVKVWGFFKQEMELPNASAIEGAVLKLGWNSIEFKTEGDKNFIRFQKPGMEIDVGGIGKGYICDQVSSFLSNSGVKNYLVNVGGNLRASGLSAANEAWMIGVKNPRDSHALVEKILISEKAVSTSGDYERYFMVDGKRFSHILNPKTGWPTQGRVAVTVVADSALKADAASTVLFLTPVSEIDKMFHQLQIEYAIIILESEDGELQTLRLSV